MQELISVMTSVGTLMAVVAGGLSVISFCYAGVLWMTAGGDPQKTGQARMALVGAIGGLIIVGIAFVVPRVISQVILEPVGGVSLALDTGFDCDTVLRQQLVFQRAASNQNRINQVVSRIQAQRSDTCSADVWNPRADDNNYVEDRNGPPADYYVTPQPRDAGCWLTDIYGGILKGTDPYWYVPSDFDATGDDALVGSTLVPSTLRNDNSLNGTVRSSSGRDSRNNIIVYWGTESGQRPADNARCWLYVHSTRTWDETY